MTMTDCLRYSKYMYNAVFLDVPTFVPKFWEYGNFSVRQSYTHFVAQETSITRKLFIFKFFHQKKYI